MKLFLPKQHGAWAMLTVPFLLGMVAGGFDWLQLPLLIGWVALYLATYPLILAVKKKKIRFHMNWFFRYFIVAVIFALPVLIVEPFLLLIAFMMVPFFIINLWFGKRNKDRSLLNDFAAITAFGISGIASYYLGGGYIDELAWSVFVLAILFFYGSAFFVKTMIREKKNPAFRWISWGYHVIVVGLFLATGAWMVTLAFIPSLARAIYLYGRQLKPMQIGILEIGNSLFFLVILSVGFF
ncbi:YwiC-like protein [Thalassobacillus cyri]|uniref:YwiC-like protein n=1 Tax=Thalassobacillus cyri TaxID=571932 RepID=A0A1H3VIT0_9BACI|nr:YwiC-like family protein [Thalassobacillus cyri]SDZ74697.1 YwiC-like protein [Thalassobacillus cyri]